MLLREQETLCTVKTVQLLTDNRPLEFEQSTRGSGVWCKHARCEACMRRKLRVKAAVKPYDAAQASTPGDTSDSSRLILG